MDKLDIQRKKTSFEKLFSKDFYLRLRSDFKMGRSDIRFKTSFEQNCFFFALQLVSKLNILINKGL